MADTQRSLAAIIALLANNTAGDISAQDMRDVVETLRMRSGQLSIADGAGAAMTILNTTDYVEATAPAWTLLAASDGFNESGGNGRLTYIGVADVMVQIALSLSFSCASNNQILHLRIGKNGTTDPTAEAQRKIGIGTDVGSTALHLITTMSTGDYLSLWVRNETSTAAPTIVVANLQAVTMPK
jgi:hypothetical protein